METVGCLKPICPESPNIMIVISRFLQLLSIACLVLMTACSRGPSSGPGSGVDGGDVALATHPNPPVALDKTTFLVSLPENVSAEKDVRIDLSMPGMYHGPNRPPCGHTGDRQYLCTGYFVMGGVWEVVVEADGRTLRTFTVEVKEKPSE